MPQTGLNYEDFCTRARLALKLEADRLSADSFRQLRTLDCAWHPKGFAVFHIDDNHPLGKLRLHIWPDSDRVTRSDDAPIHTHVWHLCSRILTGTYSETLYEKSGVDVHDARAYYSADIDYLIDKDSFTASRKAFLKPVATTRNTHGEFHEVEANVPHETLIAEKSFVATLLLTSLPVSDQATMYSPTPIPASTYDRPALTDDEKTIMLQRLDQELKIRSGSTK